MVTKAHEPPSMSPAELRREACSQLHEPAGLRGAESAGDLGVKGTQSFQKSFMYIYIYIYLYIYIYIIVLNHIEILIVVWGIFLK